MAINVKSIGAIGDGRNDDTTFIQCAIEIAREKGEPVFLPAGRYRITKTIKAKSSIDIFGEDSNLSVLIHDIKNLSNEERRKNAVCLHLEDYNADGDPAVTNVSLRRFSVVTTEPRLILGDPARQTGIFVLGGVWNFIVREVQIKGFYQGMFLRECWTARILNCSIEQSLLHCLKWENATAGEISGCRLDCIGGNNVTGKGDACTYVTFAHIEPYRPTSALSVTNNSFQHAEEAGFKGVGLQNLTMSNNFFENNNRSNNAATAFLHLEGDPGTTPAHHFSRIANIIGGHFYRSKDGRGKAIRVENYEIVNLFGIEIDPHSEHQFNKGIEIIGNDSKVNIIGVHAKYPNSVPSTANIQNSILGR